MNNDSYKSLLKDPNHVSPLTDKLNRAVDETKNLKHKEYAVYKEKIEKGYQAIENNEKLSEAIQKIDLEKVRGSLARNMAAQIKDTMARTRTRTPFASEAFSGKLDLSPGTLLAVCGSAGNGKSTTTANAAYEIYKLEKKIAILSNEETVPDIYTRIACLALELDFNNRHLFSPSQEQQVINKCTELTKFITVFDDLSSGEPGTTTTWKGIKALLKKLETGGFFKEGGTLIIDYYQNLRAENPSESNYYDLKALSRELQSLKNRFPVPIIVMVQMRPIAKKKDALLTDYVSRVRDCKEICNDATHIIEAFPFRDEKVTLWVIHKNRFGSGDPAVFTKWVNGKYRKPFPGDKGVEEVLKKIRGSNE